MNIRILLLGAAILCFQNTSLMAMDEPVDGLDRQIGSQSLMTMDQPENDLETLSRSLNASLKAMDQESIIANYYLLAYKLYQEQGIELRGKELSDLEILEEDRMKKLRAPYKQQKLMMAPSTLK